MLGIARFRSFSTSSISRNLARVQHKVPEWSAPAVFENKITNFKSTDFNNKWLVLFFYPLDWTFVCPTEIIAFSESADKFKTLNCQVAGVSIDSQFSHLAWINTSRRKGGLGNLNIPLIADVTREISAKFGVLVDHGPDKGLALRGTFIVDPEGILRHVSINDLGVGRNVDEVLRLVEAFQFHLEHGSVCPANWVQGERTMEADPVESKTGYFEKVFEK